MKKIRPLFVFLSLFSSLAVAQPLRSAAGTQEKSVGTCDVLWSKFQRRTGNGRMSPTDRVSEWAMLKSQCADKNGFFMRMSFLHLDLNDYELAERDLKEISTGTKERKHADLMLSYYRQLAHLDKGRDGSINYKELERKYKQLTMEYPTWFVGHEMLAQFSLYAQNFGMAEQAALSATQIVPDSNAYSLLTMSSYLNHDYEQAIKAGIHALEIDPSLVGTPDFSLRLAAAYLKLKNVRACRDILGRLTDADPGVKDSPAYQQILAAVNN